ncbi:MAG: hypothetical protein COA75_13000 [Cellvibrionales bacterium]|nr:MAG: hypothetical protein COB04_16905 [Gammaproteobacteria bacterium]PCJ34693.1 MAG: hypothetical protein COA75_13000 [Cellvibrionales bacterium]
MSNEYDEDFGTMLDIRGSRQLELLRIFIETNFPERNFTLIDHGCGTGALLSVLARWYPKACFYGVDFCDRYAAKWDAVKRQHKNIKGIFLENFLSWGSSLPNHADIIFSNAATMYLDSKETLKYLDLISHHTDYLVARDIDFSEAGFILNETNAHYADIVIANCKAFFKMLEEKYGEDVGPMKQALVEQSAFKVIQYDLDREVYVKDPDSGVDMETLMNTEWYAVASSLPLSDDEKNKLSKAFKLYIAHESVAWRNWYFQVLSRK